MNCQETQASAESATSGTTKTMHDVFFDKYLPPIETRIVKLDAK